MHRFDAQFEISELLRQERCETSFVFDDQDARSLVRVGLAAVRHKGIFSEP